MQEFAKAELASMQGVAKAELAAVQEAKGAAKMEVAAVQEVVRAEPTARSVVKADVVVRRKPRKPPDSSQRTLHDPVPPRPPARNYYTPSRPPARDYYTFVPAKRNDT